MGLCHKTSLPKISFSRQNYLGGIPGLKKYLLNHNEVENIISSNVMTRSNRMIIAV